MTSELLKDFFIFLKFVLLLFVLFCCCLFWFVSSSVVVVVVVVDFGRLNLFNAELSPKRYWRGPRSQELGQCR